MLPAGKQPTYPIMLEKLRAMETCIEDLRTVVARLVSPSRDVMAGAEFDVFNP